jgi:PAS domain S-box-containing protein
MALTRSQTKKKAALRARAEKRLRDWGSGANWIPKDDVLELIHELEVHRVELEMQNEELRRSQSEIEGARKKYSDLYDLAPVGYMTLDRGGQLREINIAAAEILGRPRRSLKGSRFARFVDPSLRNDFYGFCRRLFESGKREELELRLCPPGKATVVALLSGVAILDEGGNWNLAQVAITDITARVAAEHWRQG